jgi:hypothetical protein
MMMMMMMMMMMTMIMMTMIMMMMMMKRVSGRLGIQGRNVIAVNGITLTIQEAKLL